MKRGNIEDFILDTQQIVKKMNRKIIFATDQMNRIVINTGNGLEPSGNKPLLGSMLT